MAFSKTEICNLALGRIGASTIMEFDGTEKNARVCKNAYELVVKEASRSGEWACLKKRVVLAKLATDPAFEWDYQYQLPVDCLAVVRLNGLDGANEDEFDIEGTALLTDADTANIVYVSYQPEPAKWDALFTSAVVALLASRIATSICGDDGKAANLLQEYERLSMPKAGVKNFNEVKRRRFDPTADSLFLRSRYVSTNG